MSNLIEITCLSFDLLDLNKNNYINLNKEIGKLILLRLKFNCEPKGYTLIFLFYFIIADMFISVHCILY